MKTTSSAQKARSIEELCGQPKGSFAEFVKKKESFLHAVENQRKDRIRASRKVTCELAWAA